MSTHVVRSSSERRWTAALFGSLALASTSTLWAQSRPVVLEASTKLFSPDPNYSFYLSALSGNDLLALGYRSVYSAGEDSHALFHYERQNDGSWSFAGRIASENYLAFFLEHLALENNVAVFGVDIYNLRIFEKTTCCWINAPLRLPQSDFARDVELRNGTLAVGASRYPNAYVFLLRRNAAGEWVTTAELQGPPSGESSSFVGPLVGFSGNTASAGGFYLGPNGQVNETHIFDFVNGAWQKTAQLSNAYDGVPIGNELALRALRDEPRSPGEKVRLLRRNSAGAWNLRTSLHSEEPWTAGSIAFENGLAYVAATDDLRGENSGSVAIFAPSGNNFVHRATLVANDATPNAGFGAASIDGRRIAVAGDTTNPSTGERTGAIYVFELPATLPSAMRVQDDFQDANAAGWTPWGTTNWRVRPINGSYVYRQLDVQGGARSVLDAPVLKNQGIEADVTVRSQGSTSWVGLVARYVDPQNFYYLLVDQDSVEIRRMLNGRFGALATAPFSLKTNITHRLRLETVGSWIRAFVDGKLVAQTIDEAIPEGRAGLTMWKTAADFDNVIVSTSPSTVIYQDAFAETSDGSWTTSPSSAWQLTTASNGATVFRQSSPTIGGARAINGAPAADQIISADLRPRAFNASGTGWVGLIARYVDDRNHYYVLLGDNDRVSVRKLSNGAITVLEEVPFTINAGTSYRVRLEAIGDVLQLYINGRLLAEGRDSQFRTGRYGLMTYRAAADFDSFMARRP